MIEVERLSWTVTIFLFVWLASQCIRLYQRRRLRAIQNLPTEGQASLIVIVSSHCAICPAQKKIIAELCALYPLLLRAVPSLGDAFQWFDDATAILFLFLVHGAIRKRMEQRRVDMFWTVRGEGDGERIAVRVLFFFMWPNDIAGRGASWN